MSQDQEPVRAVRRSEQQAELPGGGQHHYHIVMNTNANIMNEQIQSSPEEVGTVIAYVLDHQHNTNTIILVIMNRNSKLPRGGQLYDRTSP